MNLRGATRKQLIGWSLALIATCLVYGRGYINALSTHTRVGDFFQEWASARNYWEGLPIYTPQAITAWRYLQYRPDYKTSVFVGINGHPPACVLLSLPFAKLDYQDAFLLWNLLSIVGMALATLLVVWFETGTVRTWIWLPVLTLVLSNSLVQHLLMGQLGICLLLLLMGMVWADDRGRPTTAGLLLGTAFALKVFPGLFLLYFAAQRKWRTIFVTALTTLGINLLGIGMLGLQAYEHFFTLSMPEVLRYRDWWTNFSLTGWWFKLFDATSGQTVPFWSGGVTARVGSLICVAAVIAITAYAAGRAGKRREARLTSLALFFPALVLASPVAWDHYFLLLLWPGLRLALRPAATLGSRWALRIATAVIWLNPLVLYALVSRPPLQPSSAIATLAVVCWPTYAVLTIYCLNLRLALQEATVAAVESGAEVGERNAASGGASLVAWFQRAKKATPPNSSAASRR